VFNLSISKKKPWAAVTIAHGFVFKKEPYQPMGEPPIDMVQYMRKDSIIRK
jgi:hypothetical protein